jgi:hypothetical protein
MESALEILNDNLISVNQRQLQFKKAPRAWTTI